jgi:ribosomal protein S18 acetylase RimI-like enzyme
VPIGGSIVTIRPAQAGDVPALARLLIQVHEQHVREHPRVFRPIGFESAKLQVAAEVEAGLCAVHESQALDGMVKWSVQDRPETIYTHAARIVVIDQIVVDVAARRGGIGQRLLAWVVDRAREAGASRVQLDTWATNAPALAAFRKAGFVPIVHRQSLWTA